MITQTVILIISNAFVGEGEIKEFFLYYVNYWELN